MVAMSEREFRPGSWECGVTNAAQGFGKGKRVLTAGDGEQETLRGREEVVRFESGADAIDYLRGGDASHSEDLAIWRSPGVISWLYAVVKWW